MCHHYKNIVIEVSMRGATRDHLKSVFDNALLESAENIYLINYFNESFRKYLPVNLQGEKDLTVIRDFIAKDLDNLRDEITANHNVDIKIINNPIKMVCFLFPLKNTSEIYPPKGLEIIPDRG